MENSKYVVFEILGVKKDDRQNSFVFDKDAECIINSDKYISKIQVSSDKQQGFINIRIKDVGDFIQVEIEDNGRGISARDLPYIFDRFYRADASRNSATGGSGIGLSIVKKIIEDHGGKIWATSKESIGTVMYFVIRKYQEVPNE